MEPTTNFRETATHTPSISPTQVSDPSLTILSFQYPEIDRGSSLRLPQQLLREILNFLPPRGLGCHRMTSRTNLKIQQHISARDERAGISPTLCEHLQIGKELHLEKKANYQLLDDAQSKVKEISKKALRSIKSSSNTLSIQTSRHCELLARGGKLSKAYSLASSDFYNKELSYLEIIEVLSQSGRISLATELKNRLETPYYKNKATISILIAQAELGDISGAKATIMTASQHDQSEKFDEARKHIAKIEIFRGDFVNAKKTILSIVSPVLKDSISKYFASERCKSKAERTENSIAFFNKKKNQLVSHLNEFKKQSESTDNPIRLHRFTSVFSQKLRMYILCLKHLYGK